jgi:signal transduction histidine kinase
MPVLVPKPPDLVQRLADFDSLAGAPRAEIEWLAEAGELRRYAPDEMILRKGEEVRTFFVVMSGRIVVSIEQASGHRHIISWIAGSLTGVLPYSRLAIATGDIMVDGATELLGLDRDRLPELTRECPTITEKLVHVMVDRARLFTGINWQDEKLLSMGRLAAGLAHELDNPASAGLRSAKLLDGMIRESGEAAFALGAAQPSPEQRVLIAALLACAADSAVGDVVSPLERSSREDAVTGWLGARGIDERSAAALADSGLTTADLDRLAAGLPKPVLDPAVRWVAAMSTSCVLAHDVEQAVSRIHELVAAVKRFTYVDRAGAIEPTDIALGLQDTVAVLGAKAGQKSVVVELGVAADLPRIPANSAALNQVWANLLENALEAVPTSGRVLMDAACRRNAIVVRIVDNGPGIPSEVQERMFDPFFTTKKVGEGSGLGLHIARRVVRELEGEIEFDTRPGRTEFRVVLPVRCE